ncbi:MAG: hypothetical protein ABW168_08865, partial [Sedimenticola sp.]
LWRVIENKDINISDMSVRYERLLTFLNEAATDTPSFMNGNIILYEDVPVKKNKIYDSLLQTTEEFDVHACVLLSVILPALAQLIKKQYGDHLSGGIHANVNPEQTKSVDKHNKFPERIFSYVDHILAAKPNIKTLALESHITFALNKTGDWLSNREDVLDLILESRGEVMKEPNSKKGK